LKIRWRFWATAVLKFIGTEIVASIVFYILLSNVIEVKMEVHRKMLELKMTEDELDKLIVLKA